MLGNNDDDSDQSISEEEDLGLSKSSKNFSFSLHDSQHNKVLWQLEILRKYANELGATASPAISSRKRQIGLCVEDDIEFPVFNNEDNCPSATTVPDSDEEIDHCRGRTSICNLDEEILSDEEKFTPPIFGSTKVDRRRRTTWSDLNREVEARVCLNENTGSYLPVGSISKLNKFSKGGRRKVKPNLFFRFRSWERAFPTVVTGANEISMPSKDHSQTKESHACANRNVQNSKTEPLQILNGRDRERQEQNLLLIKGPHHGCHNHSVTELLECLREKSGLPQGNPEMDILSNPKPVLQQRTMADQFHEVFEAGSRKDFRPDLIFHRESSNGLFDKLQNMMVMEKERDMDFLKKFGIDGNSTDGRGFLDVRILSSNLEAKLNVCCCALVGDVESLQWSNHFQMRNQTGERILNIIFSSRICSDVVLEVGNLIRICSPWKEVSIKGKDEMIILSTYFSEI